MLRFAVRLSLAFGLTTAVACTTVEPNDPSDPFTADDDAGMATPQEPEYTPCREAYLCLERLDGCAWSLTLNRECEDGTVLPAYEDMCEESGPAAEECLSSCRGEAGEVTDDELDLANEAVICNRQQGTSECLPLLNSCDE